MAINLSSVLKILAPKKAGKKGGISATATFNPNTAGRVLTAPLYNDHLGDIFTTRVADNSQTLMRNLFRNDPDVSAAVFSYLTMANTEPVILARDLDGKIDREATKQLVGMLKMITAPTDYTQGFQLKKNIYRLAEEMRYMTLLRGGPAVELVLDKQLMPSELRMVDLASVEWTEKTAGAYKPTQKVPGVSGGVSLDVPTFFVSFFRRDPTDIYTFSTFVSGINTIAARQQVINDLYRIMQRTGYPRITVKVVEEVLAKNCPASIAADPAAKRNWMNERLSSVQSQFVNLSADDAIVTWDSVEPSILNDKNPGMGVDISSIIETLNAQNQAALKTMSTVIGRGTSGVNTSSVEARIAAMNADELNEPVAEILTNVCSYLLHTSGFQGFAEVYFIKAELRPETELEPQLLLRSNRLRQDLSDGLISDDEYHLMLYNRLPPEGIEDKSGTGFMTPPKEGDLPTPSGNDDPLGRSLTGEGKAS